MFVKTQFEAIINLAHFERIDIEWSVKYEVSQNVHHLILAKSEHRENETLAQFPSDRSDEVKQAFEDLFQDLLNGETAFDMSQRVLKR